MSKDISEERIQRCVANALRHNDAGLTYEQAYRITRRNLYVSALWEKIMETCIIDDQSAGVNARYIYDTLPEEMHQNIKEWVEDKPITEIAFNGQSIYHYLQIGAEENLDFMNAAMYMAYYIDECSKSYNIEE